MTTVTTTYPARSDRPEASSEQAPARPGRRWALAGVGAGLAGVATMITSGGISAVYDRDLVGDPEGVVDKLATQAPWMFAFHTVALVGALLMVVFAAGLHRRLASALPASSTLPLLAFAGLLGTAVVTVMGTALDTEFMLSLASRDGLVLPESAVLFNHWVGTVPWVWVLAGLSAVSLFAASRAGALPRWMGRTGLVLGALTLLMGVSPFQYMAILPGALWLLVTGIGLLVGDKAYRHEAHRAA